MLRGTNKAMKTFWNKNLIYYAHTVYDRHLNKESTDNKPYNQLSQNKCFAALWLHSTTGNAHSSLLIFSPMKGENILTYKFQSLPFENAFLKCRSCYLQIWI